MDTCDLYLASDTCDLYFSYKKVNHLLYTCPLDPFEDGILLDTPLVCMHWYCRSFTDDEEECKRQGSPTPSAREAWKRRRKKRSCCKLQAPDDRRLPDVRRVPGDRKSGSYRTSGPSRATGRPVSSGRPVPVCVQRSGRGPCIPFSPHLPLGGPR